MRALVIAAVLLATTASQAAAQTGWIDVDLGSGHRARRYLPTSVRTCDALPLLLFLHGAGGTPEAYESTLTPDAEAMGMVLILPLSTSAGWSDADVPVVNAALDAVDAELTIDATRQYVAGHSAGGAFAYLLAYGGTGLAAVFTMSAPYYGVSSVADTYRAPIHMYYGDMDPNYTGGGAAALASQWTSLGIPNETDLETGYGHSTWPASSITSGFAFLLAHRYPGTPTASTCGGSDAATTLLDAGADAAIANADATTTDAATATDAATTIDAGATRHGRVSSGCGCRIGTSRRSLSLVFPLALVISLRARRGSKRPSRTVRSRTGTSR